MPGRMVTKVRHWIRVRQSLRRERLKSTKRSPHWIVTRDQYLKDHPLCAACGSGIHPQVHHKWPYHLYPELELDPTNLMTLCMGEHECHLKLGHGGDFRAYNPNVMADAVAVLADPLYRAKAEGLAVVNRQWA